MEADEFKTWRKELGLTQKEAARRLNLSVLTIQQYERGRRHDNNNPVKIPARVSQACTNVGLDVRKERGDIRLRHKAVPDDVLERTEEWLSSRGIKCRLVPALVFFSGHYDPFSDEIEDWLIENVSSHGYALFRVPDAEAEGGGIVVLHFFNEHDGFWFVMTFAGRGK